MAVLNEPPSLYRNTELLHITLTLPENCKYPAKQHARSVARRLPSTDGLIVLLGMPAKNLEDSDMPLKFRQRRDFLYLSGVTDIPGCALTYGIDTDILTLFIPPLDPTSVLWSGMPLSTEECHEKFDVDAVTTTAYLASTLASYCRHSPSSPIYTLPLSAHLGTDAAALRPALSASRCYKSAFELSLLRQANAITASAHATVLATLPHATNEAHLEAAFTAACIARQAKTQAYDPIVCAGRNAATLHYTRNDAPLRPHQLLLIDAAAEWQGYCADVTRTVPISGSFSKEAREIYDLVQTMQDECIARTTAGEDFRAVHALAHRIAVRGLLRLGILTGHETEILAAGTSRAFFPHGLGHMLGLDVHDVELPVTGGTHVGTYDVIEHPLRGGARVIRPMVLEPGMVVTVEPGIYFQPFIIKPYLAHPSHGRYIDADVLERYWDVGGVRIEDDILVLPKGEGNENLTGALKGEDMLAAVNAAWAEVAKGESR